MIHLIEKWFNLGGISDINFNKSCIEFFSDSFAIFFVSTTKDYLENRLFTPLSESSKPVLAYNLAAIVYRLPLTS